MQRYQPPHLRQQPSQSIPGPSSSSTFTSTPANRSRPSRWSSSNTPTLSSPATDLKPMRKLVTPQLDSMEMLQSVSRSGGDGAEGDALKDWGMQERFRTYINERLDKHYTLFSKPRHTAPKAGAKDELESLGSIVLLFRKLREGVIASHRIDTSATEVFESSARLSILTANHSQLLSSLSGLVPGLYQAIDKKGKSKGSSSDSLVEDLAILSVSPDHRVEFTSLLLLYQLVRSDPGTCYHTLQDLTAPQPKRLYRPFDPPDAPIAPVTIPFLPLSNLTYATSAARALSIERFSPIAYFKLLHDSSVSPYERIVLSWAEEKVRDRVFGMMKRAYMDMGLVWAGRLLGGQEGLEGFVEGRGGRVEGGKVKLK